MKQESAAPISEANRPGDTIRALRKKNGMTLSDMSEKTGLAVSTLSKLEKGHVSLSYDKLMLLSKGLGVDMAQLFNATPQATNSPASGGGRRVVHRSGDGQMIETNSSKQLYLATELLNKQLIPLIGELKARTIEEFIAEFGDFIRHPGEEFCLVLEGEVEFHTDLYAPLRLSAGDSVYFDSEMGHAYLKASDAVCRIVAVCSPTGRPQELPDTIVAASERLASSQLKVTRAHAAPGLKRTRRAH